MNQQDNNPFHTEWIEQYLAGDLRDEELARFENRLNGDPAFRHEVALQRTIVGQTQLVGRADMRAELKTLHREMGFTRKRNRNTPLFYAIAAAVTLLLVASAVFYFYFPDQSKPQAQPVAMQGKQMIAGRPAYIPFQTAGQAPDMGFAGAQPDSTIAILIYPTVSASPAYQFNDTLRLYGSFETGRLTLQYDPAAEQYTLYQDSLRYPLQRYRPLQALRTGR